MVDPRTYVFDLDGTICTQMDITSYDRAEPVRRIIDKMKELKAAGCVIVINTARGMNTYRDSGLADIKLRALTERWLKENGVPYDALLFGKPPGDVYVDDKAIRPDELS